MNAIVGYLTAPVPRWLAFGAIVATGVAAVSGSYFYLEQKFEAEFEQRLEEEVAATARFYNHIRKDEYPTATDAADALLTDDEAYFLTAPTGATVQDITNILKPYKPNSDDETVEEGMTLVSKNVFTDAVSTSYEWDEDAELEKRVEGEPFVISEEEFDKSELNQASLVWFEEDDVLSDDKDVAIQDVATVIGNEALSRFGEGSDDPNIVYVQNDKLDCVFEVRRNEGKYVEQVLGFIQHDDSPGLRRFRNYDE